MNEYKATNIRKGTYNGKKVKFFDMWEKQDAWVFAGHYTAPVSTANKNLIATIEEE